LAEITDMAGGVTKILLRSEGGVGPGSVNAYSCGRNLARVFWLTRATTAAGSSS
jgi:hypothetical protein